MQPVQKFDVVVIGGGPAGLLAGGRAGQLGMKVAILEKMEKPARKLRITGKGRCNITNLKSYDDFVGEIVPNSHFLAKAFGNFFSSDIINLLESNGVPTVTERGQRVFPASGKAWDVAEALVGWAKRCGAQLFNHYEVESLLVSGSAITGLKVRVNKLSESIVFSCKAIVVATGGKSYPATGSTGDG
ncbi:MAG TPA: NAD(P)/FAD-dependent oxidoreductase, partial [Tenuifilaceae bacterium]|nr:NAD(P)/FAD-dependent oxidoreductase [Tenuifilaceae bacterium]